LKLVVNADVDIYTLKLTGNHYEKTPKKTYQNLNVS